MNPVRTPCSIAAVAVRSPYDSAFAILRKPEKVRARLVGIGTQAEAGEQVDGAVPPAEVPSPDFEEAAGGEFVALARGRVRLRPEHAIHLQAAAVPDRRLLRFLDRDDDVALARIAVRDRGNLDAAEEAEAAQPPAVT